MPILIFFKKSIFNSELQFSSDFLKLTFVMIWYSLLTEDHRITKNKNVKEKSLVPSGKYFPPSPRAKIVIPPPQGHWTLIKK